MLFFIIHFILKNKKRTFLCFNVYLFSRERERQSASWVGAEREGDTESKQAPGSVLSAQSPTEGSNSQTPR